jgi:transcriptional regulator with XRE-family HTH domain
MTTNDERLFNEALGARVAGLRKEKDWTAEQMAIALGIPAARYRKYEGRTPLPGYLIPRLAAITSRTVEYILTGRDDRPPRKTEVSLKKRA